jgi:hypothetical protein
MAFHKVFPVFGAKRGEKFHQGSDGNIFDGNYYFGERWFFLSWYTPGNKHNGKRS